jgi:uncharacterized protein (TIGR02271 family)
MQAQAEEQPQEELVIPIVAEAATIRTEEVVRGVVRVHKRVETYEETLDAALTTEAVTVERVPINTFVEGEAPQMREENGVIIIPVLEEVLVVEKRLLLREEVRLTRQTTNAGNPQTVSLRREVVEIERNAPDELPPEH